jgi:hypothetical protein
VDPTLAISEKATDQGTGSVAFPIFATFAVLGLAAYFVKRRGAGTDEGKSKSSLSSNGMDATFNTSMDDSFGADSEEEVEFFSAQEEVEFFSAREEVELISTDPEEEGEFLSINLADTEEIPFCI